MNIMVTSNQTTGQLSASELKTFEFNISRAKTQIVLQQPFWAVLLLKRELILDYATPTASINRRSQIRVNPKWAQKFSVAQLMFLLCHEVGHEVFDHINRRAHRDAGRWNRAGDAVINDTLKSCNIGEFIDGGVDMPGSMNKTTDAIYAELPEDEGGGGPGGTGSDLDDSGDPITPDEIEAATSMMKVEIAQAATAAKMAGKMTSELEKIVHSLLAVKTPWQDILERHMVQCVKSDYTWARPNRRFISMGHYLPSAGQVAATAAHVRRPRGRYFYARATRLDRHAPSARGAEPGGQSEIRRLRLRARARVGPARQKNARPRAARSGPHGRIGRHHLGRPPPRPKGRTAHRHRRDPGHAREHGRARNQEIARAPAVQRLKRRPPAALPAQRFFLRTWSGPMSM